MDRDRCARTSAGHGARRQGTKAYRYHERFREVRDEAKYERLIDFARARRRSARALMRISIRASCRRKGAGHDRPAAGDDAHPCGERGVRQGQRQLWTHDPSREACPGRRLTRALPLSRKARQGSRGRHARSARRALAQCVAGASRSGALHLSRRAEEVRRVDSDNGSYDSSCARSRARTSRPRTFALGQPRSGRADPRGERGGRECPSRPKNVTAAVTRVAARLATHPRCRKMLIHPRSWSLHRRRAGADAWKAHDQELAADDLAARGTRAAIPRAASHEGRAIDQERA